MSGNPFADSVAHLDAGELAVVLDALEDAAGYRGAVPRDACRDCRREYGGLCYDHATDLLRAGRYAGLAAQLRQEAAS